LHRRNGPLKEKELAQSFGEAQRAKLEFFFYIFPLFVISLADCKRHLTNSVGQRTSEAKKAAEEPANAFSNELRLFVFSLSVSFCISF
jgi:hypothetical protein